MQGMKTSCGSSIDHCQHVFWSAFTHEVSRWFNMRRSKFAGEGTHGAAGKILAMLAYTFYFTLKMPHVVPVPIILPSEESWSCAAGPSLQ